MLKKIDDDHSIIIYNTYPSTANNIDKLYTIILGIGGNIGNTIIRFKKLYKMLYKNSSFKLIQSSIILKNPPFGYLNQNDFYNAIIVIKTNFNPKKILSFTQSLEKRFKRKRAFKNSPRTLDIDIIFIKKGHQHLYINQPNLIVPHPKWFQRNSVLIPLQSLINGV
jgi:2-amino-4-hydroxy-6-hydroxymethyldihydropteridine diphosphokinase